MKTAVQLRSDVISIQTKIRNAGYYTGALDGDFGPGSNRGLDSLIADALRAKSALTPPVLAATTEPPSREFTDDIYRAAIKTFFDRTKVTITLAQIKAFKEVESGNGWFTDNGRIAALDGPGGWIDGTYLPKVLYEAHLFDARTAGKYRATYPNLSSAKWNKSLYIGGAGEWERLWKAMSLDRTAALMSASVGTFQIVGMNYNLAGFDDVEQFWDAHMHGGAKAHMDAFVNFIINNNLTKKLSLVSNYAEDCRPIASGYNGKSYAVNNYHIKIATAHKKYVGA